MPTPETEMTLEDCLDGVTEKVARKIALLKGLDPDRNVIPRTGESCIGPMWQRYVPEAKEILSIVRGEKESDGIWAVLSHGRPICVVLGAKQDAERTASCFLQSPDSIQRLFTLADLDRVCKDARREENEACAKIAETAVYNERPASPAIVAAIRARMKGEANG